MSYNSSKSRSRGSVPLNNYFTHVVQTDLYFYILKYILHLINVVVLFVNWIFFVGMNAILKTRKIIVIAITIIIILIKCIWNKFKEG